MREFGARIGRVKMKTGGADIRVLNNNIDSGDGEDWRGSILANARGIAALSTDDEPLSGYVVIGLFEGGTFSVGYRYNPERCHVPRSLFPAWISEIIRRDMIMEVEARQVFDEKFEWVE